MRRLVDRLRQQPLEACISFLVVAGLSSLAAIPFIRLHPDAGASVSGRAPVARSTSPVTPV